MIDYLIHELVKERFEFHGNAIVVILTSLIGVILKITLSLIHLVENWIFYYMLIGLTQQTTISCNRPLYGTTTVR